MHRDVTPAVVGSSPTAPATRLLNDRRVYCNYMYTFVLDNRCPVVFEGRDFATYGNNLQGDVIQHDYFGKENVIEDLKKFDTYQDGYVELTKDMFQRNNNTNNVFKIEK